MLMSSSGAGRALRMGGSTVISANTISATSNNNSRLLEQRSLKNQFTIGLKFSAKRTVHNNHQKLPSKPQALVDKCKRDASVAIRFQHQALLGTYQSKKGSEESQQASADDDFRRSMVDKNTSLVIFDKDGTLICFDSMWTPWAKQIAENMKEHSNIHAVETGVHEILGYCPIKNTVKKGLLAEGTMGQIKAELISLLVQHGLSEEKAKNVVSTAWCDCDTTKPESIKAIGDLKTLFKTLKDNNVKIAICTSDNRKSTVEALEQLDLLQHIDMVVCGDDHNNIPKPHPYNALKICSELNVHPNEACMVGDTIVDVEMGKSAKLGSSVGVLSGVGRAEELREKSDILLHKVGDLIHLIFPKEPPTAILKTQASNITKSSAKSPRDSDALLKNEQQKNFFPPSSPGSASSQSTSRQQNSSSTLFSRVKRYFSNNSTNKNVNEK